ncbi:MAG: YggS family pyridoxal phosphate-dependent enzyme [Dehalococcoidia bacterium]|nr:YggS family pyridoxal phosphate-dependent enzyme [Dehalococcoidia bacterium]
MITARVQALLAELPVGVELVAAAKGRTVAEVLSAIQAGVKTIGENYLQETQMHQAAIGRLAAWHFIGSLQRNKVGLAVGLSDMIETVDSLVIAQAIDRHAGRLGKLMPVLIEINSGREPQKAGVMPEKAEELISQISHLTHIRIKGLMTMGPRTGDPEAARPYFTATHRLFEHLGQLGIPNVTMAQLSMGMTNSYQVALEEGANIVRLGNKIFDGGG